MAESTSEPTITSVSDCMRAFAEMGLFAKDAKLESFATPRKNKHPWHLWFRGEPCVETQLLPKVFRLTLTKDYINETSAYNYARSRYEGLQQDSDFATLCKMQHHGFPTRLLDWTDDVGAALFFAIIDQNVERDSFLYCINARRLNAKTGMQETWMNIHDDSSWGTVFRCQFIHCQSRNDWYKAVRNFEEFHWDEVPRYKHADDSVTAGCYSGTKMPMSALDDHCLPVAVFPASIKDSRLKAQSGLFTLHGGKTYASDDDSISVDPDERLPAGTSILDVPDRDDFLRVFRIPGESKPAIRRELAFFAKRADTMFPDGDMRARHVMEVV